jgi:N utilization substance protein B
MRFRKYSRKHAFNILYRWDITGENLKEISKDYWKTLEDTYSGALSLADKLLNTISSPEEFDHEVFAKKFENLSEEEILADKLRKLAYAVFLLLKSVEEFHNFSLAMTEWISERNRKRKLKAYQILNEIKRNLNRLMEVDKERASHVAPLVEFLERVENNPPASYEEVKALEEEFKKLVSAAAVEYLKEIKAFAGKRLKEDMGEIKEYAQKLVDAYDSHKIEIDSTIEEFLKDWTLDRLGSVERNILRLGAAEFLYVGVQDPGRAFNDYIDFTKSYVGKKAAKFVNGVLSAIYNKKVKGEENPAEGGRD